MVIDRAGFYAKKKEKGTTIVKGHNIVNGDNNTIIARLEAQNEELLHELLDCQKRLQEAQAKIIQLLEGKN